MLTIPILDMVLSGVAARPPKASSVSDPKFASFAAAASANFRKDNSKYMSLFEIYESIGFLVQSVSRGLISARIENV